MSFRDLTGQKFGKWSVVSRAPNYAKKGTRWNCVCDCGNKVVVYTYSLTSHSSKSCGCLREEIKDLTGQRFGKLTAVSFAGRDKRKQIKWNCICDCGKKCVILLKCLLYGQTKSCGCLVRYSDKTQSSKNALLNKYKRSAKIRGHSFNLSLEELLNVTQQNCHYCGKVPSRLFKHWGCREGFLYNGIDRLNSEKGYEFDNIVASCKECNYLKWRRSKDEFLIWLKTCYSNLDLSKSDLNIAGLISQKYNHLFCVIGGTDSDIINKDRLKNPDLYYSKNTLYCIYKKTAGAKGRPFKLNYDEFFNFTQQECFYCGTPPNNYQLKGNRKGFYYNGIDRVNNSLGYIKTNVVTCCKDCNDSKSNLDVEIFLNRIKRCHDFLNLKEICM